MNFFKQTLLASVLCILVSNYCYGQELPISVYGYSDIIGRDIFEREFPNGAKEDPPPTFIQLRTHILLSSKISPT